MKDKRGVRMLVISLVGIALVSLIFANFAVARTSEGTGTYQSGVFANVYGWESPIYLNTSYQTLLSLELPYVPVSAYYYVVLDGYAITIESGVTAYIAIGVDSLTADGSTNRAYSIDLLENHQTGIHTERLYYLDPGVHTFYFLGKRGTSGDAAVTAHTITAIIFSDGSLTAPAS